MRVRICLEKEGVVGAVSNSFPRAVDISDYCRLNYFSFLYRLSSVDVENTSLCRTLMLLELRRAPLPRVYLHHAQRFMRPTPSG